MGNDTNSTPREDRTKKSRGLISRPTFKQRIQIIDLLRAWKDRLLQDRPHVNEVAEQMSKELGFPITGDAVRSARKAVGIVWATKFTRGAGGGRHSKLGVHRRVRALELQVQALRDAIFNLCDRVGESPPVMIDRRDWPEPKELDLDNPKISV